MANSVNPHIIVDPLKITVVMPFNLKAKEELKKLVPYEERSWDGISKTWKLTPTKENYELSIRILKKYFPIFAAKPIIFNKGGDVQATFSVAINTTSFYTILQVADNATLAEIKKGHRLLVMKLHPDKGGNAEHFRLVQKAYQTLSHPKKKARYDRARKLIYGKAMPNPPVANSPPRTPKSTTAAMFSINDYVAVTKLNHTDIAGKIVSKNWNSPLNSWTYYLEGWPHWYEEKELVLAKKRPFIHQFQIGDIVEFRTGTYEILTISRHDPTYPVTMRLRNLTNIGPVSINVSEHHFGEIKYVGRAFVPSSQSYLTPQDQQITDMLNAQAQQTGKPASKTVHHSPTSSTTTTVLPKYKRGDTAEGPSGERYVFIEMVEHSSTLGVFVDLNFNIRTLSLRDLIKV